MDAAVPVVQIVLWRREYMSFLERLANPNELMNMTMNEKLLGTLYVAVLGIGITFLVLFFLQYCIKLMSLLIGGKKKKEVVSVTESNANLERPIPLTVMMDEEDEIELVAVLTAAVAAYLGSSADRIVIRNVRRVQEQAPGWAKAGLLDQMTTRRV